MSHGIVEWKVQTSSLFPITAIWSSLRLIHTQDHASVFSVDRAWHPTSKRATNVFFLEIFSTKNCKSYVLNCIWTPKIKKMRERKDESIFLLYLAPTPSGRHTQAVWRTWSVCSGRLTARAWIKRFWAKCRDSLCNTKTVLEKGNQHNAESITVIHLYTDYTAQSIILL